jgi:hypothetical protein
VIWCVDIKLQLTAEDKKEKYGWKLFFNLLSANIFLNATTRYFSSSGKSFSTSINQ